MIKERVSGANADAEEALRAAVLRGKERLEAGKKESEAEIQLLKSMAEKKIPEAIRSVVEMVKGKES